VPVEEPLCDNVGACDELDETVWVEDTDSDGDTDSLELIDCEGVRAWVDDSVGDPLGLRDPDRLGDCVPELDCDGVIVPLWLRV